MNLANQITIFRILLIPVFIGLVIYYGDSARGEHPNEALRIWAAAVFGIAAISDAIDGWIARRFNQRTRFGAIVDPLADKLLMLSAIILLSFTAWRQHFPLWFPILVIGRDLLSIGGAFLIDHFAGKVQIHTHWSGKVATFAQMAAILWILLDFPSSLLIWPTLFAGFFTALSGFINLADGVRQLKAAGHD
ncbi:CDP-diacylglycerol--glycerol-3-phosphate 3-phosphatidyltransferase [Prosthecobacter sp.]|uniref:CDP-diacylglycerol--glycerol-3-phosphate 3-phosphatidyltransferase n=1 Tax=Prosthecobacter sp. TaxID=1965333 RepID=UPI001D8EEA3D|nr:CDP-diacylglycerol--glycerol-3-phosphate 3-phosphatidyltransferase [Prosthecobacter sp.]MCB1277624.1 CDP-diacylglycerol--glycerol-3-phosphate 3-phosphatidyltransferase [Prosthecobacter sp.]